MQRSWTQLRIEASPAPPSSRWLQTLYELWHAKRRDNLPHRCDIDPLMECDLRLVPHLFLFDVLKSPIDFRYRLVGTAIVAVEGRDNTGKRLGECGFGDYEGVLRAIYERVVDDQAPFSFAGTMLWRDTDQLKVEALHLPLTTNGGGVDMILGAALFSRIRDGALVQWTDR